MIDELGVNNIFLRTLRCYGFAPGCIDDLPHRGRQTEQKLLLGLLEMAIMRYM